ncbi:MAG: hypothetical protein V1837_04335 [Candidatus Woesearchaeota archaeon]
MLNNKTLESALSILGSLGPGPACLIYNDGMLSSAACSISAADAFEKARDSCWTGTIAGSAFFNRPLCLDTAKMIEETDLLQVYAPSFDDKAVKVLEKKTMVPINLNKAPNTIQLICLNKRNSQLRTSFSAQQNDLYLAIACMQDTPSRALVLAKESKTAAIVASETLEDCALLALRDAGRNYKNMICYNDYHLSYDFLESSISCVALRVITEPEAIAKIEDIQARSKIIGGAVKVEKLSVMDTINKLANQDRSGLNYAVAVTKCEFDMATLSFLADKGIIAVAQPSHNPEIEKGCRKLDLTLLLYHINEKPKCCEVRI